MEARKQVRDFVEPVVVCAEFTTLGQVLPTLRQGKPVAIRWPAWQLLLPENVVGYPSSRRIIDLPLLKAPTVPPDLPVEEALIKLREQPIPYALADEGTGLLGIVAVDRLRKYAESDARDHALEAVKVALREKELFIRESHHRIKNNLQIIVSLLSLQASYIADPHIRAMFTDTQERVKSMALIHDTLHQSGNMGEIDFAVYVRNLASQLIHAYNIQSNRVTLNFQIDDLLLDINKAIPCGLILNELISNAVKHAFPAGSSGEISIELRTDAARQVTIVVRDTGIGFPVDMEFRHAESLGLQLVCTLTEQLDGTIDLERSEGTAFTLTFRD